MVRMYGCIIIMARSHSGFNISYVGKGYYKIIAEHFGKKHLTVENDTRKAGVNVVQKKWVCKFQIHSFWKFCEYKRGVFIFRSKTGTVSLIFWSAVYAPYTNIWTYTANGSFGTEMAFGKRI